MCTSLTAYAKHPKSGSNPKTVASWERRSLAAYLASCNEGMERAQDISVAMDASRFGCPKEETLLFAAFSVGAGRGCMPPPQVLRGYKGSGAELCGGNSDAHIWGVGPELPRSPSDLVGHAHQMGRDIFA